MTKRGAMKITCEVLKQILKLNDDDTITGTKFDAETNVVYIYYVGGEMEHAEGSQSYAKIVEFDEKKTKTTQGEYNE